jgi:hypothetical protein
LLLIHANCPCSLAFAAMEAAMAWLLLLLWILPLRLRMLLQL